MRLTYLAKLLRRAGRGKWFLTQGSLIVIFSLMLLGEALIADRIEDLIMEVDLKGASVFVITAPSNVISATDCLDLRTLAEVESVGFLSEPVEERVLGLRSATVPVVGYGGDMLRILDPDASRGAAGHIAGAEFAHAQRLAESSVISMRDEKAKIAAVIDVTVRAPEMNGWLFYSDFSIESANSCWIELKDVFLDYPESQIRDSLSREGEVTIRRLAESVDDYIPVELFEARRALVPLGATATLFVVVVSLLFEQRGRLILWSLGLNRATYFQLTALRIGSDLAWVVGGAFTVSTFVLIYTTTSLPSTAVSLLFPSVCLIVVVRLSSALRIPRNLIELLRK